MEIIADVYSIYDQIYCDEKQCVLFFTIKLQIIILLLCVTG